MADSSQQDILREYLISLGFKVDAAAQTRFGGTLTTLDKKATQLGRSIVGVALATQTLATEFAYRMEKLYYSSKLAESSAGNLQALQFAGKQSGIADMTKNVEALARNIRANPGLQGLLNSLGVRVTGRDKADVMMDLVKALKGMPFYVAQRYAELFGINPDDLLLMQQGIDKIKEAADLRKRAAQDLGIDTEKANRAGLEYAQQWREILMYVGLFRDALTISLLPAMQTLAGVTKEVLKDWTKIVQQPLGKTVDELKIGLGLSSPGGGVQLTPAAQARVDAQTNQRRWDQMTVEERRARGLSTQQPTWYDLSPAERAEKGMPVTEDAYKKSLPWWARAGNAMGDAIDGAFDLVGMGSQSNRQGVELSSQAKERLGGDRTKSDNPGVMRGLMEKAADKMGYKSKQKTPTDPAAIDAVTEPDRVLIEREQKLSLFPDAKRMYEELMRRGDYAGAREIMAKVDQIGKPQPGPMEDIEKKFALKPGFLERALSGEDPYDKHSRMMAEPEKREQRNLKLSASPEMSKALEEAIGSRDYAAATQTIQRVDAMPDRTQSAASMQVPAPLQPSKPGGAPEQQSFLDSLEQRYALPKGLLDKVWNQESARGKALVSPKGAEGPFGFMPETGKQYGLQSSADRMDFSKSAGASASMYSDLMKKYNGNIRYALAAYNWGSGNLDSLIGRAQKQPGNTGADDQDRYVLGHLPAETQKYISSILGGLQSQQGAAKAPQVSANTTINVYETSDARATGQEVADQQREVFADITRQFAQRVA